MAAPSAPLVVVGPQFCAPHALPLTLTKKFTGWNGCTVTDAGGAVVLFTLRRRDVLVDAAGMPVLSMEPMYGGIAWLVFRGDSGNAGDLLFTARMSSRQWPLTGLDVFLAGNSRKRMPDFKVKTNVGRSRCVYLGNSDTIIASINFMKSFGKTSVFGVTVFPHVDQAFITALVLILGHVITYYQD